MIQRIAKSPLLWGCLITFIFYTFLDQGIIRSDTLKRYLAMHPVEYIETGMFFVGIAALLLKFFDVLRQRAAVESGPILPGIREQRVDTRACESYLKLIGQWVAKQGESVYSKRMHRAVQYVRQCESAEQLDQELRFLADDDAMQAESDYGFVQLIIWAIPILGFLGTVVGIALAMGNLVPEELETSLPLVMDGLTVAFDTTAIALAFSIVLYFSKFAISKQENQVLWKLDRLVDEELRGRFELQGPAVDNSQVLAVRKMLESVVGSIEELIEKQTAVWDQSIELANSRYSKLTAESAVNLKSALTVVLRENIEQHAAALGRSEEHLLKRTETTMLALNESMRENLKGISVLQDHVARQVDVFRNVIDATGQLARLEDRLNQNLAALGESKNFGDILDSLAAAIHLLNTKNMSGPAEMPAVQLQRNRGKGQAA